jgi:hypothetical protein
MKLYSARKPGHKVLEIIESATGRTLIPRMNSQLLIERETMSMKQGIMESLLISMTCATYCPAQCIQLTVEYSNWRLSIHRSVRC